MRYVIPQFLPEVMGAVLGTLLIAVGYYWMWYSHAVANRLEAKMAQLDPEATRGFYVFRCAALAAVPPAYVILVAWKVFW